MNDAIRDLEKLKGDINGKYIKFASAHKQIRANEIIDQAIEHIEDLKERVSIMEEGITHCDECRKRYTSDCPMSSSIQLRLSDDFSCKAGERRIWN